MSHTLVQQLQQKAVPVRQACQVLNISRSGYCEAVQRRARVQPVCVANVQVQATFHASGGNYGSRRLRAACAPRA